MASFLFLWLGRRCARPCLSRALTVTPPRTQTIIFHEYNSDYCTSVHHTDNTSVWGLRFGAVRGWGGGP
eukprot:31302-Prymnesium_polylepis.1